MITVSPNRVANYRKCPANAGYEYVYGIRKRNSGSVALRRAQNRGSAIHAATLGVSDEMLAHERANVARAGEAGDGTFVPEAQGLQGLPGAGGLEYAPALAEADARMIWAYLDKLWPGATWQKEQTLSTQLTPNIRLEGRMDMWCLWEGAYILPDLKTSTSFHTKELSSRATTFDHQLILYARILRDHVGVLPQVWRFGYNPNSKRGHRRQYLLSDELIEQASRYAVHVACSLERMSLQTSLEWHRTFSCDVPYPCAHFAQCARETGAWYSDGKNTPPVFDLDTGIPARPFESPIDVGDLDI